MGFVKFETATAFVCRGVLNMIREKRSRECSQWSVSRSCVGRKAYTPMQQPVLPLLARMVSNWQCSMFNGCGRRRHLIAMCFGYLIPVTWCDSMKRSTAQWSPQSWTPQIHRREGRGCWRRTGLLPAEWMAKAAAEGAQRVEHQVWEEDLYPFPSDALPLLLLGSAWSADI